MTKIKSIAWLLLFIIMFILPCALYYGGMGESVAQENRVANEKPEFSKKSFENYSKDYELYYNDNIPFRNELIFIHNSIDYYVFKKASSDRVIIGKNNWLFYCDSMDGNPLEQSLGYWKYTDDELKRIADNLITTKKVLEDFGIDFVVFISPNKETIYSEMIPDLYKKDNGIDSTVQLIEYLQKNTDIKIVYPKEELEEEKKKNPDVEFYYRLDTHWNNAGAYVGAQKLAQILGIDMPLFDNVDYEMETLSTGDLAKLLNVKIKDASKQYYIIQSSKKFLTEERDDVYDRLSYCMPEGDERILFVKRDSFGAALADELAPYFRKSIWQHTNFFKQQQVFDANTDVFVLETAERYVSNLIYFKISFVSVEIKYDNENMQEATSKCIIISPQKNLECVTIQKKDSYGREEIIQTEEGLEEKIEINVPIEETGEVEILIYENDGKTVLDTVVTEY